jgi:ABC-type transport system substrate-binding protein
VKPLREMETGELAAYVAEYLRQSDINVVLTGGSGVSIYTDNRYQSYDLDFIETRFAGRKKIAVVLTNLGFQEKGRYFTHPDTPFFIEFPAGPLAIGDEAVHEIADIEFPTGISRLLSPIDCVKDRLAHYYHWKDRQCLEQAIMVAATANVDLKEIERWSRHEGMEEKYRQIREMLERRK